MADENDDRAVRHDDRRKRHIDAEYKPEDRRTFY